MTKFGFKLWKFGEFRQVFAYKILILPQMFLKNAYNELTYVVEEVVGSLYLVPVEEMRLTELEVLQVVLFDERLTGHVEGGKEPTPPRTLLVGHRLPLSLYLAVVDMDVGLQAPRKDQVLVNLV